MVTSHYGAHASVAIGTLTMAVSCIAIFASLGRWVIIHSQVA